MGLNKSQGCSGVSAFLLQKYSTMGQYFIPWSPMDSVMRLCSDLQQNSTPFQLSVKIVGSVDFHLSTMPGQKDENENNRSSRTWHQRGPSYLRRQLKRSLENVLVFYSPSLGKYFQSRPNEGKFKDLTPFFLKGHFCRLF